MDYIKFITQYKTAKDKETFCKKHIKTKYVSYVDKMSQAQGIAMASCHSIMEHPEVYKKNTPAQYFSTIMRLIDMYTDIEYKDEETVKVYDELAKNEILNILISSIPESEVSEFRALVDMAVSDIYENERDLTSFFETKLKALELTGEQITKSFNDVMSKIDLNKMKENISEFPINNEQENTK